MNKGAIKNFAIWARAELIKKIKAESVEENNDSVIEERAYILFSYFIALRFIEVNGYLKSINNSLKKSDKFQNIMDIFSNMRRVFPEVFKKIDFPFSKDMIDTVWYKINEITEEDWKKVQIIGWLYQEYNSQKKAEIFAELKKSKKISRENISAVTQLFTPDWIVKYMVENSLGRFWDDGHRRNRLKKNWKYFISEEKQSPKVEKYLKDLKNKRSHIYPEDIRCIDPCVGTGHILCYLFDLLMDIYMFYEYDKKDAVKLIIEKNLYALDIDERAGKLAYFSVMMKGLEYDEKFLEREYIPRPNIYTVKSSRWLEENGKEFIREFTGNDSELEKSVASLISQLRDGNEYGSILEIENIKFEKIYEEILKFKGYSQMKNELLLLCKTGEILSEKYDIVVTNPPYMSSSSMNKKLADFVKKYYPDSKYDLYGVFIERCKKMTVAGGYLAMVTQHSWMFITSFEKLREKIQSIDIVSMVHLGPRAFEDIEGAVVQTVSFIFRNSYCNGYKGTYVRLTDGMNQKEKEKIFLSGNERYVRKQKEFKKIPGIPLAYWVGKDIIKNFEKGEILNDLLDVKVGIQTGDNERFIRLWYEVDRKKCSFHAEDLKEFLKSGKKWVPYNKGGQYRKWYGNYDYVVNWENSGNEIKNFRDGSGKQRSIIRNPEYQFRECITWGLISAVGFSMRYRNSGGINDVSGMSAFDNGKIDPRYILGLMNTPVAEYIFSILNPTINVQVGDFKNFPVLMPDVDKQKKILKIVDENIKLSKIDWDMNEISWDFAISPLIKKEGRIPDVYETYKEKVNKRFDCIKENEETLAKLFIELYGLEKELSCKEDNKNITVSRIYDRDIEIPEDMKGNRFILTKSDVIKNLISFGVGCILGRYNICQNIKHVDVVPIMDEKYFEDDIVDRFIQFIRIVFGERYLEENLEFIGKNLNGRGDCVKKIRNYFFNNFYKEHCKMYQKRPVYWQLDFGKKKGIKFLIYIHNYKPEILEKIKDEYLKKIKKHYINELSFLNNINTDKNSCYNLEKKIADLRKSILETEMCERKLEKLINSILKLDFDKGIKENYSMFEGIVTEI